MTRLKALASLTTAMIAASLFVGVGTASANAPISCLIEYGGGRSSTQAVTLDFFGRNSCGPEGVAMSGQAKLFSALGTLEAQGNPFNCGPCNIAGSAGTLFPAGPFTTHKLVYDTTITLPPGHIFVAAPAPQCTGVGTPTVTCHIEATLTA